MRILLVDDEYVSRVKLGSMLSQWGIVESAETGAEARKMYYNAMNEDSPYDLLVLDIELPDDNGITLLKEFSEIEDSMDIGDWRSRKIIITGESHVSNVLKARKACCDAFLVKPVSLSLLRDKMKQIWKTGILSSAIF